MQSVSKITIPELEMFGFSSMNAVKALLLLYGYEMKQVRQKYPSNNIDDLHGYKAFLLEKLMHSASTYIMVVEECQDYVVASSILRTMLDGISVYHLIYQANQEEILLRHYLYILDGVSQKLDIDSRHPLCRRDKITEEEYKSLVQKLSFMRNNLNQAKDFCIQEIRNLEIYPSRKSQIERLILKSNWKFKSFENPKEYKWSELHDLLPTKFQGIYSDFCDYLSQHVHGLSMSNLTIETANKDLYEPLSANVALVLYFIHVAMLKDFEVDMPFLTKGLLDSEDFRASLAYYSESYKNELFNRNT